MTPDQTLFVVDDDDAVRRALISVAGLLDVPIKSFASASDFLESYTPDQSGCLVLDIKMPGMTGLELQRLLLDRGNSLPIVMISGHADVRVAVDVMKQGAITLLEKPFSLEELLRYVRRGLEVDRENRLRRQEQSEIESRIESLTTKERVVLDLITAGRSNREIAEELGLSIRAVEDRRARVMKKLKANTFAELLTINR